MKPNKGINMGCVLGPVYYPITFYVSDSTKTLGQRKRLNAAQYVKCRARCIQFRC